VNPLLAGLDHRATVRWITYQEFCLLTHPTVPCDNEAQLTDYIRDFVIAALVREPASPTRPRRSTRKAKEVLQGATGRGAFRDWLART
jgi:hypothetical protein